MSTKYKATMPDSGYFITITTVGWVDIFTRLEQRQLVIESLDYCSKSKGLEIYTYVIMPSHIHMLCKAKEGYLLSNIIRDFKKHTSKKIIKTIQEHPESRRKWLLEHFAKACVHLKREQQYKVWQDGYHVKIANSNWFIKQKIEYIHNNPVVDKIVACPEEYIFSSGRNYASLDNELEIITLDVF